MMIDWIRWLPQTVIRLGRFGPYLFIVPATTAIGALASTLAGSVAVVAIGAVIGLGWGVLVGRIAGWLSQRQDRSQSGESVDVAGSSSSDHAVRWLTVRDDAVRRSVGGARDRGKNGVRELFSCRYANPAIGSHKVC